MNTTNLVYFVPMWSGEFGRVSYLPDMNPRETTSKVGEVTFAYRDWDAQLIKFQPFQAEAFMRINNLSPNIVIGDVSADLVKQSTKPPIWSVEPTESGYTIGIHGFAVRQCVYRTNDTFPLAFADGVNKAVCDGLTACLYNEKFEPWLAKIHAFFSSKYPYRVFGFISAEALANSTNTPFVIPRTGNE